MVFEFPVECEWPEGWKTSWDLNRWIGNTKRYSWLTNVKTQKKNQENCFVPDRGFRFGSWSCRGRVTISSSTVSHLLTVIMGDDRGGFSGSGIVVYDLSWKRLFPIMDDIPGWYKTEPS